MKIPVSLLLLGGMCVAQTSATPKPERHEGLSVAVEREAASHAIVISLTNKSAKSLWINRRGAVSGAEQSPREREFVVAVKEHDGTASDPHLCRVRIFAAKDTDYGLLRPGEVLRVRYDLARCFPNVGKKVRIVEVSFEDGRSDPPNAPTGTVYVRRARDTARMLIAPTGE